MPTTRERVATVVLGPVGNELETRHAHQIAGEMLRDLPNFERAIRQKIGLEFQLDTFPNPWRRLSVKFCAALADSRPLLLLSTPPAPGQHRQDPSCGKRIVTPAPSLDLGIGNIPVILLDSDGEGDLQSSPGYTATSKRFDLAEVRDILRSAYVGLPNLIHPVAIERMIKLSQGHWREAAQEFLGHSRHLCQALILEQVQEVFGHHQDLEYYQSILGICEEFLEEAFASLRQAVQLILRWELTKPHTLNAEGLNRARGSALALLQTRRREVRSGEKVAKLSEGGELPPDPYTVEVEAMSRVKGYYEYAHDRFAATLWASIDYHVFSPCAARIVDRVQSMLGATEAVGTCQSLPVPPPRPMQIVTERLLPSLAVDPECEHRRAPA